MPQIRNTKCFSALHLKCIALLSMLIDHLAVAWPVLWRPENQWLNLLMRGVGRIAFPIFAFFVAEGAIRTRSREKYLLRLGLLALLCELPFDYMWAGRLVDWRDQSTAATLFLALCGICLFDLAREKMAENVGYIVGGLALLVCLGLSQLCLTDYGPRGVFLVYGFYAWRTLGKENHYFLGGLMLAMAALWADNPPQLISLLAFFLIFLYNGKLGKGLPRLFFYAAYWGQLALFALLRFLSGGGAVT